MNQIVWQGMQKRASYASFNDFVLAYEMHKQAPIWAIFCKTHEP